MPCGRVKGKNSPDITFTLTKRKLSYCRDSHAPEADELKKNKKRNCLLRRFRRNSQRKEFKKVFQDYSNERSLLKNPPRGYEKEHPAVELLN
jgi:hypothetical protein